eukprot:gene11324-18599_t
MLAFPAFGDKDVLDDSAVWERHGSSDCGGKAGYLVGGPRGGRGGVVFAVKAGSMDRHRTRKTNSQRPASQHREIPARGSLLERYHKVDLSKATQVNNWNLTGVPGLPKNGVLDMSKLGLPELSMRVRTGRNLARFPLPASMTKRQRLDLEVAMGKVFDTLIANPDFGGEYVSISPGHARFVDKARFQELVDAHIMFKDMSQDRFLECAGISSDWPHGRGAYISADKQFIVWVGEEDHLRIMCMQKGTILNAVFDRLKSAIDVVEGLIEGGTARHPEFGVVTSCPTNIGTGMRASVHIRLPHLTADGTDTKVKAIAKPLGLSVRGLGGEHTPIGADGTVDISPSARFCISEAEIVTALYLGLGQLKAAED